MTHSDAAVGDSALSSSDDASLILSVIGERDLAETIALQEAIMLSQMPSAAVSGNLIV